MEELQSSVLGFAIGDALAFPVLGEKRTTLIEKPVIQMLEKKTIPKGTYSGGTSLLLATMDAMNQTGSINPTILAASFLNYYKTGKYGCSTKIEIGLTTKRALEKIEEGVSTNESGGDSIYENDADVLERMLPIAFYTFWNQLSLQDTYIIVTSVSSITHRHPISHLASLIYVLYIREILNGENKEIAYQHVIDVPLKSFFDDFTLSRFDKILKGQIPYISLKNVNSTNYVVDTLEAFFWVIFHTNHFNEALIGAVNLGENTTGITSLVGSVAGLLYPKDTIKQSWLEDLKNKEEIFKLCDTFQNTFTS